MWKGGQQMTQLLERALTVVYKLPAKAGRVRKMGFDEL
jgi:hypothetical protein